MNDPTSTLPATSVGGGDSGGGDNGAGDNGPGGNGPGDNETGRPGNAWERRGELGFLEGLAGALRGFVTAPGATFAETRTAGDLGSPLLFAVLVAVVTGLVGQIWAMLVGSSMLTMLPAELQEGLGALMLASGGGFLVGLVIAPIMTLVWIFIWGAIVHVLLVLVGGLDSSEAGFEGTLRVVAYSSIGNLAKLVPVLGGLISVVWMIFLMIIGLNRIHGTSEGRAVAAVLLPVVLCCACGMGLVMVGFGAIMSGWSN